ncbi:MAG: DUF5665 domain-containing protein [Patescibacteria group bacterium]
MPQQQSELSSEQIEKNIVKLAHAVEKTYGSAWSVIWRNFLAGITRAFGITFGYVAITVLLFFIAKKLGVFEAIQDFWKNLIGQIENFKQGVPVNPSVFKDF